MEKKLTALQELIEMIETFMVVNDDIPDYHDGLEKAHELAKSLLPKEREQIEEAFNDGYIDGSAELSEGVYPQYKSASDYFTQTYQPTG